MDNGQKAKNKDASNGVAGHVATHCFFFLLPCFHPPASFQSKLDFYSDPCWTVRNDILSIVKSKTACRIGLAQSISGIEARRFSGSSWEGFHGFVPRNTTCSTRISNLSILLSLFSFIDYRLFPQCTCVFSHLCLYLFPSSHRSLAPLNSYLVVTSKTTFMHRTPIIITASSLVVLNTIPP